MDHVLKQNFIKIQKSGIMDPGTVEFKRKFGHNVWIMNSPKQNFIKIRKSGITDPGTVEFK